MVNGYLICQCLKNFFRDCVPFSNDHRCKTIFYGIMSVQLLLIITGLILNSIIVSVFCKQANVREKIPNILLFHQAIADLFNGGVYGITRVTYLMVKKIDKKFVWAIQSIFYAAFIISLLSSIFLCTVIAIHRFVSIYFPIWHRVHLTERHVQALIIVIWLVPIPFVILYLIYYKIIILWLIYTLIAPLVIIITVLFISTFIKAFLSLQIQSINSTPHQRSSKRQLRLSLLFLVMFMEFALVYIPQTLIFSGTVGGGSDTLLGIMFTLLLLTSVVNPILTLSFRKQFRIFQSRTRPNNNRNGFQMQMQVSN